MIKIVDADTTELISDAKALFREYAASLNFDLCFQGFDQEMAEFPGQYTPPSGGLYVARSEERSIGCIGFRYLQDGVCEMKRLYVQPDYRGNRAGLRLAMRSIEAATAAGYRFMRLDTLQSMKRANQLYRTLGFVEIAPYRPNPIEGALYLELDLSNVK